MGRNTTFEVVVNERPDIPFVGPKADRRLTAKFSGSTACLVREIATTDEGSNLPLADPVLPQFSDANARQWEPQDKQQDEPPPWHASNKH